MRRLVALSALLFAIGFGCLAKAQMVPGFPPGTFHSRAALDAAAAGGGSCAATCPGDLKPYVAWWGFSCYNAAYTGNVASVWDTATGNTTHTLLTCSAGGTLNQTINTLATTCAVSCEIETMYDQSGALACAGGTACDVTHAHASGRPLAVASGPNSNFCASITTAALFLTTANTFTQTQPYSAAFVANRTGNTAASTGALVTPDNSTRIGYAAVVNKTVLGVPGGTFPTGPTATDSALHAIGYVVNNASSLIGVDATAATSLNAGSATGISAKSLNWGLGTGGSFVGILCEGGIANATWSSADIQNVNANAHARYGVW